MSDNDNLNNSAPALGAGGPRFESWYPDTENQLVTKVSN